MTSLFIKINFIQYIDNIDKVVYYLPDFLLIAEQFFLIGEQYMFSMPKNIDRNLIMFDEDLLLTPPLIRRIIPIKVLSKLNRR
jgi:hypothetical protein